MPSVTEAMECCCRSGSAVAWLGRREGRSLVIRDSGENKSRVPL